MLRRTVFNPMFTLIFQSMSQTMAKPMSFSVTRTLGSRCRFLCVPFRTPRKPGHGSHRRLMALPAGIAMAVAIGACNPADSTATEILVPISLKIVVSSDSQQAQVGTGLAKAIAVRVFDQDSNPLPNAPVSWAVIKGGGSVSPAISGADPTGMASTAWTLGTSAGVQLVTATIGNGVVDTLVATATAGPASVFALLDGDNQTLATGASSAALRVRVFDKYGNAVPAVAVTWSTTAGVLDAGQSTTDASGIASVTLRVAAGMQVVTARLATGASLTFMLRGT